MFLTIEQRLDKLVIATREKLLLAVDQNLNRFSDMDRSSLRRTFNGFCGFAQCIAGYPLQDKGENVRAMAIQSLPGWNHKTHYGHATLTLLVGEGEHEKLYLIDPTFVQFVEEEKNRSSNYERILPGAWMCLTEEGRKMVDDLLTRGYTELTPRRAAIYLRSFCPFVLTSEQEAFDFCKNPPPHTLHFQSSEKNSDDDEYSREQLDKKGLLLKGFEF